MNEKKILDEKLYVEGYKNIVSAINELDTEDKTEEIESRTAMLIAREERNARLYGNNKDRKVGDEVTYDLVEEYKKEQEEIDKLKEAQTKISENRERAKFLNEKRQNVRENIKNAKNKEIENRKKEIEALESKIEKINEEKIKMQKEKIGEWQNQLQEMEEQEKNDPHRAKDSKYKEFLENKIDTGLKELDFSQIDSQVSDYKQKIEELENEMKIVNKEYTSILRNFGRIDRGEDIQLSKDQAKTPPTPPPTTPPTTPPPTTPPTTPPVAKTSLKIGREAEVTYTDKDGSRWSLKLGKIKNIIKEESLENMGDEFFDMINKDLNKRIDRNELDPIIESIENGEVDPISVKALLELKNEGIITTFDVYKEIKGMSDALKSADSNVKKEFKKQRIMDVEYDRKDLSKGAFWPWNRKTRDAVNSIAEDNKEIATVTGKYDSRNPIQKMFDRIKMGKLGEPKGEPEENPDKKGKRRSFIGSLSNTQEHLKEYQESTFYKLSEQIKNATTDKEIDDILKEARNNVIKEKDLSVDEFNGLRYTADYTKSKLEVKDNSDSGRE